VTAGRYTVTQWFAFVVGALLAIAAAGLVAGVLSLNSLTERRERLADRIDPASLAVLRLTNAMLDQETGIRGFLLTRDGTFLGPYRQGIRDAAGALAVLEAVEGFALLDRARGDAARTRRLAEAWRRDYADRVIAALRAGEDPPDAAIGKQRFDALRAGIAATQADLRQARDRARDDLDRTADRVLFIFVSVGALILVAVLAAALILRRVVIAPLSRLAADVRVVADGEFDRPVASSGPREVAVLGADVEAMRERIVAEVGALRDAERALIEQARELQRSNQELEQFAYVASHDLQEPLRKVASFTQMLERRYKGQLDERADRYIAFAVDGAKRMQELINDLLEFSRVGRVTAPHERVDTGRLLEQARARLGALLDEAGAEVEADGLPCVTGDAGLLTAVFQNLISNAVKFRGDDPPHVRFAAERDGAFWRFTCTDQGIGVDDEYAERIFVIFQRLHTRDAYEGTGIGLAMCRKIVEYHGGRIWLAPADDRRGAQFVFTLPADTTEEEPQHEPA
jgi:signal transduction histidine kinase